MFLYRKYRMMVTPISKRHFNKSTDNFVTKKAHNYVTGTVEIILMNIEQTQGIGTKFVMVFL